MKRLMIGFAAAGLCTAVFADVTSANIVGYQALDSNTGTGYTMLAPTFIQVGDKTGCTLADLKVTGYATTAPFLGNFSLKLLKADGSADGGPYYWVDIPAQSKQGWFLNKAGTQAIPGGAESIAIAAGRAFWCQGKGNKLVPAGEVNQSLIEFVSNTGTGYTAIGNSFPVDTTLDKLTVTGYATTAPFLGNFSLKLLKADGSADGGTYYWVDIPAQSKQGWFLNKAGTQAIPGGAESVTIAAGRGFWCQGKGNTLKIPAPVLK